MSGDPEQEYFADGLSEDLITALCPFRALFVIARNSTFTYKGRAADVTEVARELGVRYVVEGKGRHASLVGWSRNGKDRMLISRSQVKFIESFQSLIVEHMVVKGYTAGSADNAGCVPPQPN